MPTELEQRLRAERPGEPAFSADARERARRAVLDVRPAAAPLRRARLRRLARPARVALGGLGFAALAGFVALLIVSGPHSDQTAGLRFADHSEGGVALHLKATPLAKSGLSAQAAAAQAADAILARARAQGIEGVQAEAVGDGTLEAWVPVARTAGEAADLFVPLRLRLYDLADRVALDRSARLAVDEGRPASNARPSRFYLFGRGSSGRLISGPAPSLRALFATVGGRLPVRAVVGSLPADLLLVHDPRRDAWAVIRDRPVLQGADIAALVARRGFLGVALSASAGDVIAHAAGTRPARRGFALVFDDYGEMTVPTLAGPLAISADARSVAVPRHAVMLSDWRRLAAAAGSLPVRIAVIEQAPTGPARVRTGSPVRDPAILRGLSAPLPVPGAPAAARLDPSSLLLEVRQGTRRFGTWSVVTGRTARGDAIAVLLDDRARPITMVGGPLGCQLTPRRPRIAPCGSTGLGGRGRPEAVFGRMDAGVATVVVRFADGSTEPAAVDRDGWWLAVTAAPVRRVIGYDESGNLRGESPVG